MATKKLFSEWTKEELEITFNLQRLETHTTLEQWLQAATHLEIGEIEKIILDRLRKTLLNYVDTWNEIELIEYFIGPVLAIVDFNAPTFKIFSERTITGIVGDYELTGEPDAIIAKGRYSPQIPYFCFHEYKKAHESRGDPAAQTLAAMLVAQELGQCHYPIYGMYIVGEHWHFMTLQNDTYCISKSFAADDEEIFTIFNILSALKAIIATIAGNQIT